MTKKSDVKGKGHTKNKASRKPGGDHDMSNVKPLTKEARNDHRIPIQLLVDYRNQGNYLFDFCRDLGAGGIFIQTSTPLPKGSEIDLTFTLPDSKETLEATGEVIWVQPKISGRDDLHPGMGVQFSEFGGEQRKTLEEFVARYHGDRFSAKAAKAAKKPA